MKEWKNCEIVELEISETGWILGDLFESIVDRIENPENYHSFGCPGEFYAPWCNCGFSSITPQS